MKIQVSLSSAYTGGILETRLGDLVQGRKAVEARAKGKGEQLEVVRAFYFRRVDERGSLSWTNQEKRVGKDCQRGSGIIKLKKHKAMMYVDAILLWIDHTDC